MTAVKYWNGSAWQEISGVVGPQGPRGPLGPPTPPTGPAGGHLTGTYPNPGIDRQKVGGLIAVQRIFGAFNGYRGIANGQKFFTDAGVTPLQITYTPPVDCWWETELQVGILQKTDAAYHPAFIHIRLTPADADGNTESWLNETQNATVQTYCFKQIVRWWRLSAGVAYTAYSWFDMLATVGGWQYHQLDSTLHMGGRAWAL